MTLEQTAGDEAADNTMHNEARNHFTRFIARTILEPVYALRTAEAIAKRGRFDTSELRNLRNSALTVEIAKLFAYGYAVYEITKYLLNN